MPSSGADSTQPVLGLLGGLGVGAAVHYYRELAAAHAARGRVMQLVMVHASIARTTDGAARDDRKGLAEYLAGLLAQLKAAGATIGILPALTPHFCIDELQAVAPIPVIDLTTVVADHLRERGLRRVALFGTRYVVESRMFGRLKGVEVVSLPESELAFVHDAYSRTAHAGTASAADRDRFVELAATLQRRDGAEAIVLAGTDFAVMFDAATTPFPHVDCTRIHIDCIMKRITNGE